MQGQILVDSGAAISAVHQELVPEGCTWDTENLHETVGANGMPLEVIGRVTLLVKLGDFQADQEFTVVRNLSVDCLLGANFLT